MSFALQALTAEYLAKHHGELENRVYPVPKEIDSDVARIKLDSLGLKVDKLTPEQLDYANEWMEGT